MNDPQFGTARLLRPAPTDYATVYNGTSVAIPLMFTEGQLPLDELAGQPGYSPRLLRGFGVPYGARVTLWIPMVFPNAPADTDRYVWSIHWRMRNVFDTRQTRKPFHLAKQGPGTPETGAEAGDRVIIPAARESVIYMQSEPATAVAAVQNIRSEGIQMQGVDQDLPWTAAGVRGYYEQGVLNPASGATPINARADWLIHETMVKGDEMLLGVTRQTGNWNLDAAGEDRHLHAFITTSIATGVYVLAGKS